MIPLVVLPTVENVGYCLSSLPSSPRLRRTKLDSEVASHQPNSFMKRVEMKKELPSKQREELLGALNVRFQKNMKRHPGVGWDKVKAKLEASPGKLWSLSEMERSGGEPDVVGDDKETGEYLFMDCS